MKPRIFLIAGLLLCMPVLVYADGPDFFGRSPIGQSLKALAQLPPVWDKRLSANDSGDPCNSSRFTCVLGGEAVRDNETGLVWERSPDFVNFRPWRSGVQHCANRITGGRMGWRLPSAHELTSLVDPAIPDPGSRLPVGHPFTNVLSTFYWTSTANASDQATVWGVNLREGGVVADGKSGNNLSWCVRGAGPIDVY
jgi:hypothetical protein